MIRWNPFASNKSSFPGGFNSAFKALKQSIKNWFSDSTIGATQRRAAYHKKMFVSPIIKTLTAFTMGQGFTLNCDDPDTEEKLSSLVDNLRSSFIQLTQETLLFGHTDQKVSWNGEEVEIESIPPENVDSRPGFASDVFKLSWDMSDGDQMINVIQKFTADRIDTEINGRKSEEHSKENEYGFIPICSIAQAGLSGEHGESEISEVLLNLINLYHDLLNAGGNIEKLAGSEITPYLFADDWDTIKKSREGDGDQEEGESEFVYAKAGASIGILEAKRGADGVIKLLEVVFWNIVALSRVPEFCYGTSVAGMNTSSEQAAVLVKYCQKKQTEWEQPFKRLIKMMCAVHDHHCKSADRINLKSDFSFVWPDILRDNKLSKEILDILLSEGVISKETAYEVGRQYIKLPAWKIEKERQIEEQKAELDRIVNDDRRPLRVIPEGEPEEEVA